MVYLFLSSHNVELQLGGRGSLIAREPISPCGLILPSSSRHCTSKPGEGFPVDPGFTLKIPRPEKFAAIANLKPAYDPSGSRMRRPDIDEF